MKPPTSKNEVHQFIGVVIYYRDMSEICSKKLVTLANKLKKTTLTKLSGFRSVILY